MRIKALKKVTNYEGQFLAVGCSTRTLKRANNWGIYLMRPSHVLVKGCDIEWGYEERLYAAVGDIHVRRARATGSGKTNSELILNAQIIDNPKTVALIFDFAGQLLEGKGISPQKGLKDYPLFPTKVQYYSPKNGKMVIGLYTITPTKRARWSWTLGRV